MGEVSEMPWSEGDSLRALVANLREQLAEAHKRLADAHDQNSIRFVTDFQIGQMVVLGLGVERSIYMQSALNSYRHLLRCCEQLVVRGNAGYWLDEIVNAVAAAKPEAFR